jgi:hypothetical protein
MNLNGGVVNIYSEENPDITPKDAFDHFLENSNIYYLSSGTFGMIFKATLNKDVQSKYEKFEPSEGYSELRVMLIKITFLHENDKNHNYLNINIRNEQKEFETSSIDSFRNETNIHVDIHKKSFKYGMPLCPSIVFSSILSDVSLLPISQFCNGLRLTESLNDNGGISENTIQIKTQIKDLEEKKQITQIGIIVMEFADNYSTLYNLTNISNNRLNYYQKQECIVMALYTLIQLFRFGYTHGDHHSGNILINIDYNGYFYGIQGRPLIIDFGRTRLLSDILNDKDDNLLKELSNNGNFTELLEYLNQIPTFDGVDLNDPENNELFGFTTGKYDLITNSASTNFSNIHINSDIYNLLEAYEKQCNYIKLENERYHNIARRKPLYPIDETDPKERGLSIYDIHIGGISNKNKKNKKTRKRRKNKKTKKRRRKSKT